MIVLIISFKNILDSFPVAFFSNFYYNALFCIKDM